MRADRTDKLLANNAYFQLKRAEAPKGLALQKGKSGAGLGTA